MKIWFYVLAALLLTGCHSSVDSVAAAKVKVYYGESDLPRGMYKEMRKTTVIVTDNMFTDVNAEIHEGIMKLAVMEKADAVMVGDVGRSQCQCASCNKNGNSLNGPHVCVPVTLLQLRRQ